MRRALVLAGALAAVLVAAVVAVAGGPARLDASGPVSISGTAAHRSFTVGERTVRQVRYSETGTLGYTFTLHNPSRLPLTVLGLAADQPPSRLFTVRHATAVDLAAGGSGTITLALDMGGCESLSARAGSTVTEVRLRTRRAGREHVSTVRLPEELHTGSPREAFCPRSTATSRPRG